MSGKGRATEHLVRGDDDVEVAGKVRRDGNASRSRFRDLVQLIGDQRVLFEAGTWD